MSEVRKRKPDRDDSKSKRPVKVKPGEAKNNRVTPIGTVSLDFRIFKNSKIFSKLLKIRVSKYSQFSIKFLAENYGTS